MKATRTCETCRYWSERVAQSIGCGPVEALCLKETSPHYSKYTVGRQFCSSWKDGYLGAIDSQPNNPSDPLYPDEK